MTEHRTPILGLAPRRPLQCLKKECINERARAEPGRIKGRYFQCPNRPTCEEGAFCYPRFKREKEDLDRYLKDRGLTELPAHLQFHFHEGMDLGKMDDVIVSVVRGKVVDVIDAYKPGFGGYGKGVIVQADSGYGSVSGLFFFHGHCKEIYKGITVGKQVEEQEPIAIAGNTDYGKSNPTSTFDVARAHLHFEVSRWQRGKSKAFHDLPPEYKDRPLPPVYCEDPNMVLEQLGPWGQTSKAPPRMFFPNGTRVTPAEREALHRANEEQSLGGYFPVGANNFWHGGVHLFGKLGAPVVAPFDATIVAVRLDENAEVGNQDFGSTNFVLLKHEIPKRVADLLAPVEKAPDSKQSKDSKSGDASGTKEASVGYQSSLEPAGADIPKPGRKPKKPATNPPEYVKEIKRRLNACPREDGQPYYDAAQEDLESGEASWALVLAIYDFQRDGLKQKRPDGVINVSPGGVTYTELLSRTPTIPKAEEKSEKKDTEPPPADAKESKDSKDSSASDVVAVFSLFMHLDPRPIDEALAEQIPWLARARVKGDTAPASEDKDERDEAKRSMDGHVGPPNRKGIENHSDDVVWVQKRLTRFGLYALPSDGLASDDLTKAISDFQAKYAMKGNKGDGVVSRNQGTADWLRKTPAEIREASSEVDGKFLKALRERDAEGVCKVVSGLSVPVSAGEAIGLRGYGCSHNDLGIAPVVHWEIFSEQPLMLNWQDFQDENDDLSIDVTEPIADAIELLAGGHEADPRLTAGEVARYFSEGYGANLRQTRCLFPNEWSHEPSAVQQAFSQLGDPLADCVGKQVQPYQWWSQASDVVPTSPKVWHYNPIAFLAEYARASGGFDATVCVLVKRAGNPVAGAQVRLSAQGHEDLEATTGADGTAIVRAVSAGLYRASAVIENATTQTEAYTAEGTVAVHPTETAAITLELQ